MIKIKRGLRPFRVDIKIYKNRLKDGHQSETGAWVPASTSDEDNQPIVDREPIVPQGSLFADRKQSDETINRRYDAEWYSTHDVPVGTIVMVNDGQRWIKYMVDQRNSYNGLFDVILYYLVASSQNQGGV